MLFWETAVFFGSLSWGGRWRCGRARPSGVADAAVGVERVEDYVGWLDGLLARRLMASGERRPELSVGILLWPGFPMMSLTGIVEPLRHAADFADNSRPVYCRWAVMGEGATASCGIAVQADSGYLNPSDFDYVAVIGGLLPQLSKGPARHRDYLRAAAASGTPLIGVCTGAFVLAREGYLEGARVAVHPFHAQDFRTAFPRLRVSTRDDFLQQGRVTTVPGGVSILSLMTELLRAHCGADRAAKAVHQISLSERRGLGAFDAERARDFRAVADARIQRALVMIEGRRGKDVTPDRAASAVGLSPRQFSRLFREALGVTPKRFILETRLRHARFLVENSGRSITEIAYETGFADCAHFATAFKARFGAPPRDLRTGRRAAEPD
jgi:transcriptional regulator GlxA family with amidase domain